MVPSRGVPRAPSMSWIISTPGNSCVYSKSTPWFKKISNWSLLRRSQSNLVPHGALGHLGPTYVNRSNSPEIEILLLLSYILSIFHFMKKNCCLSFLGLCVVKLPIYNVMSSGPSWTLGKSQIDPKLKICHKNTYVEHFWFYEKKIFSHFFGLCYTK